MGKNRNTRQKEIIQKEIDKTSTFFSSLDLHKKVGAVDSAIGIATVYRYLKDESRKGNLYTYLCNRKKVYSKGKKSHCHFICENTKKVIHFDVKDINFLKDVIPGTIRSFSLEVRGVCEKCKTEKTKTKQTRESPKLSKPEKTKTKQIN